MAVCAINSAACVSRLDREGVGQRKAVSRRAFQTVLCFFGPNGVSLFSGALADQKESLRQAQHAAQDPGPALDHLEGECTL